jgi:SAM-dependent methyltransferase
MQINSGLRSILQSTLAFRLFGHVLGSETNKRWFVDHVLRLREGQKLIDVGCGPADILDRLPGVEYLGLDISDAYIESARTRFASRRGATFVSGCVEDWRLNPLTSDADVGLANGVLHHVDDDEARKIFEFAYRALKDDGRFVFYEPCYLVWQSGISTYFMSKDRGQNIRTEQEWKDLASSTFPIVSTNVVTGVNRLAYICIIGQCCKQAPHNVSAARIGGRGVSTIGE